jgi:hypothetical protein
MTDLLVKFPDTWPQPLVLGVCVLLLAGLDFIGALAAAEGIARRSSALLLLGAAAFLFLFWFYASSLQYAELAIVTFGWIVVLQVGLLLLDRFHYGVELSRGQWVAIAVLLVAQTYLLLGHHATVNDPAATPQASASTLATAHLPTASTDNPPAS